MANATNRQIPLNQLVLSPKNVRKTPASEAEDAELYASLKAKGLKQNLLVHKVGDDFHVHAGGRRLKQLQKLAADGHIKTDEKIRCVLEDAEAAEETSVAENVIRAAMHPVDQFTAFANLIDQGRSVDEVATRFGVTANLVERRLKLARVAPQILDAFRNGDMNLECVMAFTLCDDHARQTEVWESVSTGYSFNRESSIRHMLTEKTSSANSRLGRFVGLDAYKAAGGEVIEDLFSDNDSVRLKDAGLLERLAQEKLDAIAADKSKDWKWVEAVLDFDYTDVLKYGRVTPQPKDLDPEAQQELDTLLARAAELEAHEGDWTDELYAEAERISPRIEELENLRANSAEYSEEQRAISGCIVSLGFQGDVNLEEGLVRPEDFPAQEPEADAVDGENTAEGETSTVLEIAPPRSTTTYKTPVDPVVATRKEQGVSGALADDLRATRHQVLKAHLSADFGSAFDAMLYSMCRRVFTLGYNQAPIDISLTPAMVAASKELLEETVAANVLDEIRNSLNLDWMKLEAPADFEAMCALAQADKQNIFAWCTAHALEQQLSTDSNASPVVERLGRRMQVDVARFWRPTSETYWGRVKKDHALAVADELIGERWVNDRSNSKKAQLAKSMENAFGDEPQERAGLAPDAAAKTSTWLPDGMAFAIDEEAKPTETDTGDPEADSAVADEGELEEDDDAELPAFLSEAAE